MPESQLRGLAFIIAGLAVILGIIASSYDLASAVKDYVTTSALLDVTSKSRQGNVQQVEMTEQSPKTPVYFVSHGGVSTILSLQIIGALME